MLRAYTPGQIAKMVGVGHTLVNEWIDQGKLVGYRIPFSNRRKVAHEELVRFCRQHGLESLLNPPKLLRRKLKRRTVVLFGVEPSLASHMESALNSESMDAVMVANAFDAGVMALNDKVICVVIDLAVGRRNALDGARRLRASRPVLLIALTYDDEPDHEERADQVFTFCLKHPVTADELADKIVLARC